MCSTYCQSLCASLLQVVHQVLYGMLSLLDRMAAMQMTLRGPSVMGHFTGAIFETYLEPLHEEWRAIFATLQHMADAVALHLRKPSAESAQYVQQQVIYITPHIPYITHQSLLYSTMYVLYLSLLQQLLCFRMVQVCCCPDYAHQYQPAKPCSCDHAMGCRSHLWYAVPEPLQCGSYHDVVVTKPIMGQLSTF